MRNIFNDESQKSEFNTLGFITLNFWDASLIHEIEEILKTIEQVKSKHQTASAEYDLSFFNSNPSYKQLVRKELYQFFKPYLDKILDGYVPLIVNHFNKKPNQGEVPVHQNWTFVDESKYTSVSVWIPLTNVSRINGTLETFPGSHRVLSKYRSPSIPWVFEDLIQPLKDKYLQPLELQVGQAAILDDGIIHWSSENNSNTDREAIQFIMIPKEAIPIHYYAKELESNRLKVFKVSSDFFDDFKMNEAPKNVPLIDEVSYSYKNLTEQELKIKVAENLAPTS